MTYNVPGGKYSSVFNTVAAAPHAFIAGCTGSGKSTFIHGLIYSILARFSPNDARFVFIDLKRVELNRYKKIPHCIGYADDENAACDLLEKLHNLMMKRFAIMEKLQLTETKDAHIYCICDEIGYFFARTGKQSVKTLESIAMLGRAARIHLIYACQNPRKSGPGAIPAGLLLNTPCRVALRCVDKLESRLIIHVPGAETLPPFGQCIVRDGINLDRWKFDIIDPAEVQRVLGVWNQQRRPDQAAPANQKPWYKRLFGK